MVRAQPQLSVDSDISTAYALRSNDNRDCAVHCYLRPLHTQRGEYQHETYSRNHCDLRPRHEALLFAIYAKHLTTSNTRKTELVIPERLVGNLYKKNDEHYRYPYQAPQ